MKKVKRIYSERKNKVLVEVYRVAMPYHIEWLLRVQTQQEEYKDEYGQVTLLDAHFSSEAIRIAIQTLDNKEG